ncbi:hypothetical protein QR680_014387 [Steinernema hermaphroditum]|uniref:Uncharacterized protein n=1 Tax=Steinernema hermaphroditum TaxID=289476 RepID=A0AA39I8Q8_9BILA|nr:hypothetical protein QR680_014387 [Steinernema hermaphroditum]
MTLKWLTVSLLICVVISKPTDKKLKHFVCDPPCPYKTTCQPVVRDGEIRRYCDIPPANDMQFPDYADVYPENGSNVGNDYH